MAVRGELPPGTSDASDTDVRRLVEREVLSPEALDILDAPQASPGTQHPADVAALLSTAGRILTAAASNEPKLRAV